MTRIETVFNESGRTEYGNSQTIAYANDGRVFFRINAFWYLRDVNKSGWKEAGLRYTLSYADTVRYFEYDTKQVWQAVVSGLSKVVFSWSNIDVGVPVISYGGLSATGLYAGRSVFYSVPSSNDEIAEFLNIIASNFVAKLIEPATQLPKNVELAFASAS